MKSNAPRRRIRHGPDRLMAGVAAPRHQHIDAYATIVLKGAYEQLAYAGRLRVEEGSVLIQPTLDCHASRMLSNGLDLVRLPWRFEHTLGGVYCNCRVDTVLQAARFDVAEATLLLGEEIALRQPGIIVIDHWADELAAALVENPRLRIASWACAANLSREHVSREFAAVYGVSPAQFRTELNARAACLSIISGDSFSTIAANLGFADQSHMTRAVKALTGATPSQWRKSLLFKTLEEAAVIIH